MRFLITLACCLLITPIFSNEEEAKEEFPLSTPEQVATLSIEPSALIGGLISPLSGQPVLRQTDLVVNGAQNIVLSRVYIPPYMPCSFGEYKQSQEEWDKYNLYRHVAHNYKGWQFYPHLKLQLTPYSGDVLLTEPNGMSLNFRLSGPKFSVVTLASSPYGFSNAAGDTPSGKYDPRNTRICYEDNGNKIIVYATDGAVRFYYKEAWTTQTALLYLLEKEILPNGKVIKYHYTGRQLDHIESLDPKERFVYSSIRITGSPWEGNCHFTSSSGITVDYGYQKRILQVKIKEIEKHWYGDKKHELIDNCLCPPILTSVSSPFYRHEALEYCDKFLLCLCSGKDDIFTLVNGGFGEGSQHYRVHQFQLPVGQNDRFKTVYELSYCPPIAGQREGTTTLKNSDGTSIVYHFSKNLLTTLIQYFDQNGGLKKEKAFSWDNKNWLKFLEIRDAHKNLLYRKSYEYDPFGNPIVERFTGNLTGEGGKETSTIIRTFTLDGRNLLLREESEDGKVLCFSYVPNTDLVTSKLTKDCDKIILREFSTYDDCHNLIQTISDDGSGEDKDDLSQVTQRLITTYTLRQQAPFLHMPEWIEDAYLEAGTKKLLKKSHLIYDQYGNLAQEEVYDAKGNHSYTICKTYNERGDILTETNRLGQQAVYTHDARGRPETATNFSTRIQKTFRHDTKGRLREITEKGDDGVVHTLSSDYDFHDRIIEKTDPFSNSTYYTYDLLVSKIAKTDLPSIASVDGRATSVATASSYDSFGRELTKTDPNGNVTTYRYNAYGSPIEILYPHGGKESFRYTKTGQLASHTNLDGLKIRYENDVLGRALSKTYISVDRSTLAEEIFTYKGFNLRTVTDKEGNLKQYSYDGAGRKIREEFCGHVTEFSYDALGWLSSTRQHNGDNTLLTNYKRDLEGRLSEKLKTDTSGRPLYKIRYSYDRDGNLETITRYINENEAVERFGYDSFSRSIYFQDAEGFITTTIYNENFVNPLGQRVLQKITTDPLQIVTIETQDALTRPVKKEVLSSQGATIACSELIHDSYGNLRYRRDHVYENARFRNTQTVKFTYTADHQIESVTRGFGTQDARKTGYTYLPSGKMETKTLPNDITLTYSYHPLGFLSRIDSSNGEIHHGFEYDRLGYLRYALDENHNIEVKREVDPFGNVRQEVFPNSLEVAKEYDDFNRPTSIKIAALAEISYTYDPLFLRQVTRFGEEGEALYSHAYKSYDLDGNLASEQIIRGLGSISHLTESRGNKADISSPYFAQSCQYDAVGNLLTNTVDKTEHRYSYDGISQLSSENNPGQTNTYAHDSLYNRVQKNGESLKFNDLNEIVSWDGIQGLYDLNGNQIVRQIARETAQLTYDSLNRLTEVASEEKKIAFIYDPLGRRLSKTVYTASAHGWEETSQEYYLYDGSNEIGAFTAADEPKNLRVLGLAVHNGNPATIGVEIEGQIFAPVLDVQGNIRRLINPDTRVVEESYDFTAFGEELRNSSKNNLFNPWRFASKRLDPELGLIYYGKRDYDPRLGRWLTTDPAGFVDGTNLYQYLLNNPFMYVDAEGEFVIQLLAWGAAIVFPTLSSIVVPIVCGVATGAIAYGGYKLAEALNTPSYGILTGAALYGGYQLVETWKNTDVYAPDRPLPRDPRTKEPAPEADAPHTELGTQKGTKGKYPQAREFDAQGKPIKDIDFTDHGRPQKHPNPHEHKYKPNQTGGTPSRSKEAEPLTSWKY